MNETAVARSKGKGLVGWLDRRFYPDTEGHWDDHAFRDRILARIGKDHVVLDLGAGAGILPEMNFRSKAKKVCGLDPDPRVLENEYLDEARVGFGEKIPWPDQSFDIVIADNVLEHLESPKMVFAEINRVLKPGGRFMFKTPNRRHYMPFVSRATPVAFHRFYNRLRGRDDNDTFPTFYRANSARDIDVLARATGYEVMQISLIEDRPEYMRLSWLSYLAGIAYERTVNSWSQLRNFRILLIGELRKTS